jgi:ribosomal-protein-alanine N-acetyltransferase
MKFPELRELRTEDLILRKVRREDASLYYQRIGSREAVTRYMLFQPHERQTDTVETVENVLRRYETGRCYRWAIALKEDDSIIGIIELLRFDEEAGTCSFAYMIGNDFWGKGYGTQALKAALNFGFEQMELAAVEADHMAANPASGAVMRKAGMVHVRTDEGKYQKNGQIFDAPVYRITREMWDHQIS